MREYPKELNSHLLKILGMVNFACRPFAEALRVDGVEIATSSEVEQAHAIHWMLGIYLEHGDDWQEEVGRELGRIAAKSKAKG